MKQIKEQNKH